VVADRHQRHLPAAFGIHSDNEDSARRRKEAIAEALDPDPSAKRQP